MTYATPIHTYAISITRFLFPPTLNISMNNYSLQTTLTLLYVIVIVEHNIMLIYVFIIEAFTIISVIKLFNVNLLLKTSNLKLFAFDIIVRK